MCFFKLNLCYISTFNCTNASAIWNKSHLTYLPSAQFVEGLGFNLPPLVPLNSPKFVLTPEKIVKISKKYIAECWPLSDFPTNRVLYLPTNSLIY